MKNFKKIILAILTLGPIISFAAQTPTVVKSCSVNVNNIGDIICKFGEILNTIIPILLVLGVVYFVWGVVTYVIKSDEEAKKRGKDRIIYGILGFVIIVSLWGIVSLIVSGFGLDQQETTLINPATIVDTNLQNSNSSSCYSTFTSKSPKLGDLFNYATCVISTSLIPLLFILAVASFIWGVVQYVINNNEEAKRAQGREFMIWGIIALTVMVSVWGLVAIFRNTFGIENVLPQLKS